MYGVCMYIYVFTRFLFTFNQQDASLMDQIDDIYSIFEKELIDEAIQEVDNILLPLRRLDFGLPQSQQYVVNFTDHK